MILIKKAAYIYRGGNKGKFTVVNELPNLGLKGRFALRIVQKRECSLVLFDVVGAQNNAVVSPMSEFEALHLRHDRRNVGFLLKNTEGEREHRVVGIDCF